MTDESQTQPPQSAPARSDAPVLRLAGHSYPADEPSLPPIGSVLAVEPADARLAATADAQPLEIIPFTTRAQMVARDPQKTIRNRLIAGRVSRGTLFRA